MQTFNGTHFTGILLACMPKSGSTSTEEMVAMFPNIRKVDLVPGWDIREQEIDVRALEIHLNNNTATTFIAQHHVCLSGTTRMLIDRKFLSPLVLTRNLPDALVSLIDHFSNTDNSKENFLLPANFKDFPYEKKCDYVISFHLPWYLKFFASWLRYPHFSDVWLRYEDMAEDNITFLKKIADILAFDLGTLPPGTLENSKQKHLAAERLNEGISGRGKKLMRPQDIDRIKELIALYGISEEHQDYLLSGTC
ncbi:MAG: sulfotransferase domain-containing protein [Hyphomicrobiales bacterium]|nr:sulfotransferase domain-containing protein [Hyphomicrobiales bacterium]